MIIKIKNYDSKYRVVSLAKDKNTLDNLLNLKLDAMYLYDNAVIFYPDNTQITLSNDETTLFNSSNNYDVFEIDIRGNAYKCYDCSSIDNAILVTNKCNSNCIMCPTAELIRKNGEKYSADELIKLANHFPNDAAHITITGGEPFIIKKDMFILLDFLKEKFTSTSFLLLTNGRTFYFRDYARLFYENAPKDLYVGIPIHGHNSDLHDYITQATGSFVQTIQGYRTTKWI